MKNVSQKEVENAQKVLEQHKRQQKEIAAEAKRLEEEIKQDSKPQLLKNPDIKRLKEAAESYIENIANEEYVDDDLPHYIFEDVISAFYGKEVWNWVNKYNDK